MNRVYITQSPLRRNREGQMVHMYDLSAAREYGHLEILVPSGPVAIDSEHVTRTLRNRLGGFRSDDHLLCLGDPVVISAAAAIVADVNEGIIPLLVWDKHTKKYLSVRANIHSRKHYV